MTSYPLSPQLKKYIKSNVRTLKNALTISHAQSISSHHISIPRTQPCSTLQWSCPLNWQVPTYPRSNWPLSTTSCLRHLDRQAGNPNAAYDKCRWARELPYLLCFLPFWRKHCIMSICILITISEYLSCTESAYAFVYNGCALLQTIYMMLMGYAIYNGLGVFVKVCLILLLQLWHPLSFNKNK